MADDDVSVTSIPAPRQLPWHADTIRQLQVAWGAGRFPHAILLQGADGLGKRQLVAWLAASLLCDKAGNELRFCGECASCRLIASSSHPDLLWVSPPEGKQQIGVDAIRDLAAALAQTSYRRGYKVAVIEPAHQLNTSSANSLLKTLEEPTPRCVLILITSRPSALLPTVRSRCQKITVRGPSAEEALEWLRAETSSDAPRELLEFTGHAPLRALELAAGRFEQLNDDMQRALKQLFAGQADITRVAAEWTAKNGPPLPERLTWLDLWLTSAARGAIGGNADLVTFPAEATHLPSPPPTLNISVLYTLVDQVRALKAQLLRTALQRELAVESLLIALLQTLSAGSAARS
ncbi:MAG TPA: DNA polymerase III subunit delta' [Povalibacter sp.]|nr:DNA polymerase III subunit delta' [Povalibacter sp.]